MFFLTCVVREQQKAAQWSFLILLPDINQQFRAQSLYMCDQWNTKNENLKIEHDEHFMAIWIEQEGRAPDIFDGGSLQWVHLQHEHEQRGDGSSQVLRDVEDPSSDLLKQCWDVLVVEGKSSTQQGVQDHPTAPDVHLRTSVQSDRWNEAHDRSLVVQPSSTLVLIVKCYCTVHTNTG